MITDTEHLKRFRQKEYDSLDLSKKNAHTPIDKKGSIAATLSSSFRRLAMLDYLVDKNVQSFRTGFAESANTYLKLFERFDSGEPIGRSYVSMLAYKHLLDALASGNIAISTAFAQKMGGRDALEKEYDVPFTIAMGYTLKYLVLDDEKNAKAWLAKLQPLCEGKLASFKGYVAMIAAIIHLDEAAMSAAIPALIAGHKKESKGQGMFSDLLDEYLAVWAIGLAKQRGLVLNLETDLIPNELLA